MACQGTVPWHPIRKSLIATTHIENFKNLAMKKILTILLFIVIFIIKECVITHSKVYFIPAINMHLKITSNYLTDISYLYMSPNEKYGDNYIKFVSKSKKMPDIKMHLVNSQTIEIYTKMSSTIKEIKSSSNLIYVKNDSIYYSKDQEKPLIVVYGRGRYIYFFNEGRVNEEIIEL